MFNVCGVGRLVIVCPQMVSSRPFQPFGDLQLGCVAGCVYEAGVGMILLVLVECEWVVSGMKWGWEVGKEESRVVEMGI